ncbi:MAG: phosphoribosylanthranilate isomerase [Planctomycetaceae bacterium]|jgi:phosphoribosylanthranilate isomerase|nr:phosphoribosylanthranilate isomerase [Planctomycetaceae bacterium]
MTYIKICGITSSEVAISCFELGVDMIGLIYYPPSPRHVEVDQAVRILDAVEKFRNNNGNNKCNGNVDGNDIVGKVVLVVFNELPEAIDARFDYVQIHGKISENSISKIGCDIIRVVRDRGEFNNLLSTHNESDDRIDGGGKVNFLSEQLFILELSSGNLPGGNGASWNWGEAKSFCRKFKTFIAGGVSPDNVAQVIKDADPFGVDISSGVESSPAVKDMTKIKKIIDIVKGNKEIR